MRRSEGSHRREAVSKSNGITSRRSSETQPAVRAMHFSSFYQGNTIQSLRHDSVSVLHFAGFRSGPGESQGDIARDSIQILNNLGTKPKTTRPKFTVPPRVDFGRLAPQGRGPVNFGYVDFATTVASEVTGKSVEFEASFALGRRRMAAVEKLDP